MPRSMANLWMIDVRADRFGYKSIHLKDLKFNLEDSFRFKDLK